MNPLLPQADALPDPATYFQGVKRDWSCHVDNVLLFLRRTRTELQRRTFASEHHYRFVLLINLETPGVASVDRTYQLLAPHKALLIFPYQFHHYLSIPSEKIRWLFITFETTTPEALEEFRFQVIDINTEAVQRLERLLALWQQKNQPLRNNLIVGELPNLLAVLRAGLAREQISAQIASAPEVKSEGIKILSRINRCLAERDRAAHTIPAIAHKVGLSESRLRALFRQNFGLSLGSYIRNYQTHQALAMMQNSSAALYEVAQACGYSSLSTFSRAFKEQTGLSPFAFRKKHFA